MLTENYFPDELNQYVQNITHPEDALLRKLREQTQQETDYPQMLTGPVEGQLLQFLVRLMQAKTCLEIGTFTGYSAMNIANALPEGGKLISLECRKNYAAIAEKYLTAANLQDKVEIKLGPALNTLKTLTKTWDFVFLDADKTAYPDYYDLLIPQLRPGGLLVIDNTLWYGKVVDPKDKDSRAINELNLKAREDSRVKTVMLTIRDGILLVEKL